MSMLRLVFAWLLMVALPLQGLAAATMPTCGPTGHATPTQQVGHGHLAGAHGTDRQTADLAANESAAGAVGGAVAPHDDHACPICASCCQLVALSAAAADLLYAGAPASQPRQGTARVLTRFAPADEKPPRA